MEKWKIIHQILEKWLKWEKRNITEHGPDKPARYSAICQVAPSYSMKASKHAKHAYAHMQWINGMLREQLDNARKHTLVSNNVIVMHAYHCSRIQITSRHKDLHLEIIVVFESKCFRFGHEAPVSCFRQKSEITWTFGEIILNHVT